MKITAIDPLCLGYRKVDPPMARNFAVVRVETDAGIVGWGEASTNWGHSYPTLAAAGTHFHELRHFYASLLIDGGESVKAVQTRLGHANAEETLNAYAHLWPESEDRAREAVQRGLAVMPAYGAECRACRGV